MVEIDLYTLLEKYMASQQIVCILHLLLNGRLYDHKNENKTCENGILCSEILIKQKSFIENNAIQLQ